MTPFDKPAKSDKWLKMPGVGQEYDFSIHGAIVEIKKVEGTKFNFPTTEERIDAQTGEKFNVPSNTGYHYDIIFEDGKSLSISSWSPYYALIDYNNNGANEVKEGDRIKVIHPNKAEWIIQKV